MLTDLVIAITWSESLLWYIDVIVKVAVALGAVVFVHELGHFLMAKACGVKVEKFMLGFDIGGYKIAKRWGETVYGIGILPLGGYVKMFGQDDDPSHIAEQMQKSQVAAGSGDAVEKTGPNGEKYFIDRRSYLAKSVPQRMAIISAGVIMNVIFAFIFATIAFGMGVQYLPSIISGTMPGSPAWKAGFEPGDEIVRIGDRENPTFLQLKGSVTLGDLEEGIPCDVRRAATEEVVSMPLLPTQEAGELASVGIGGPLSIELREDRPVYPDSAAADAKWIAPTDGTDSTSSIKAAESTKAENEDAPDPRKLNGGDTIVSVNGVPVANYREYIAELVKATDNPMAIGVRRKLKKAEDASGMSKQGDAAETEQLQFELPTQPLRGFGIVMRMGPVIAVQDNSPAAEAGVKPGDRIVAVDGKQVAETDANLEGWTPQTLPEYLRRAAMGGQEVELTLRRGATEESDGEEVSLRMKAVVPISISPLIPPGAPMAADAIGVAYSVENRVQVVVASSTAANQGVKAGDRIVAAKVYWPKNKKTGKTEEPGEVELGRDQRSWPYLMDVMQFAPAGTEVELRLSRDKSSEPIKVKLAPQEVAGVFITPRGLDFEPIFRTRTASNFSEAMQLGLDETTDALTMVFRFLQKLGSQVPFKMLGGPGTIAVAAGDAASHGLSSLLIFLTMLSANLAVINFLPIPLLDGGHMMFLAYEGVRGRPANEKIVLGLHMAGFAFIISLMVFVIGLDIQRFWNLT